ncbi:Glycosyltransferase involved in cell wall bisynthesis (RfaB) (PDB:2IV7) [Commensalibacter communis]|uniref:Glycosyltransferase involved in cell wall bisynthesis (RfaB) n=1 Tax=Commensalibacter communis TaxID=2972786 RepID=A0A9W4TME6_9PROT|nr:Hint domain-containing protein [Commensalibacter communis]CAI3925166.1 Glycosyltransferase involved in cell wall bisynthesis (RfaB) (PDB:2IV7) [Commensalibacter communis]CAI3926667.1 Glycosyltransferase involved in cell wall bisynthesis (RfaB) (PDB:2IV7) [Commensalibacter communis]CAI3935805.1 Glycosyltransferase involved in cell wall bisynthesis (RfaB) (PDB:2IV7) [Commensalibacter communis]CAI3936323.1 Glycosyltransferase involved in cell wall bisynthesis (RfaB) (PDB:2IV7) [Commensalibacter
MANTFPNGGTNSTEQLFNNGGTTYIGGGTGNTITNDENGSFIFTQPGTTFNIYGNLINNGLFSINPKTPGAGINIAFGYANTTNSLTQTNGQIQFDQPDNTSGTVFNLNYSSITNDANSKIISNAGASSTFSAPYVKNLTNAGIIRGIGSNGGAMTSNWGNGAAGGVFNNTGTFNIDNRSATGGTTININFGQVINDGNFTLNYTPGSTVHVTAGAGGFINNGNFTYSSSAKSGATDGSTVTLNSTSKGFINNGSLTFDHTRVSLNVTDISSTSDKPGYINLIGGAYINNYTYTPTFLNQTINFTNGNNVFNFSMATAKSFQGKIRGFGKTDQLNLGFAGTQIYDPQTGILTVTYANTQYKFDMGLGYDPALFVYSGTTIQYNGEAPDIDTPCYLAGSMISTPNGDVPVEQLKIGDHIKIFDVVTNNHQNKIIIWVGNRTVTVNPNFPDDLAGYPVCIKKDAIASNIPYQDTWVTSEHCLFLNKKFVPARMLVNGTSIYYDYGLKIFDVYHIETEEHSVLFANGMLAESFLNTENHRLFHQQNNIVSLHNHAFKTWNDSAVSLDVSQVFVEPLFNQLKTRAKECGFIDQTLPYTFTKETDLHLITDTGITIYGKNNNDHYLFVIPGDVTSVHLISNASRPSDVIGPYIDDRRYFGVSIGEITLFNNQNIQKITAHLDQPTLEGWHDLNQSNCRWTTGKALLPLNNKPGTNSCLVIKVVETTIFIEKEKSNSKVMQLSA